jgi:carboxymethylproline synthase
VLGWSHLWGYAAVIEIHALGDIAELRIQHAKELNPFNRAMTHALIDACAEVEADDRFAGVLLWGGADRSFSVGGDFADLRQIRSREESEEHLRVIVRSYQAVLRVSKPLVAAIDHYAIGQGLQVALMADWRVGSERSSYQMPELANGMPCPLGSRILETLLGRAAMLHLVVGCEKLDADAARRTGLVDQVCSHAELQRTALERLRTLCAYPQLAYRLTKELHNRRAARDLESVCEEAAHIHGQSYFSGQADRHFSTILGKNGSRGVRETP